MAKLQSRSEVLQYPLLGARNNLKQTFSIQFQFEMKHPHQHKASTQHEQNQTNPLPQCRISHPLTGKRCEGTRAEKPNVLDLREVPQRPDGLLSGAEAPVGLGDREVVVLREPVRLLHHSPPLLQEESR